MKRRIVTKEIEAEIIKIYNKTLNVKQTAQIVAFSEDTVRRTLKRFGIRLTKKYLTKKN